MGNKKNKVPKKRKAPNKTVRNSSSNQKENVPKNVKTRTAIKRKPIEEIAMSKQLLLKKTRARTQRRLSSNPERVCPNGKPIPSLSELEKMFEDSDSDDQTPKSPTRKVTCATSTPEKQTPINANKKLLFSPTTINKISEQLMCAIEKQNLPDPSEVLEATALFREKTPPPAPIIPPKKRKKPDVPYIVGCKDRPKVIKKPNTNFCKGHDDYGIESGEDPEDDIPKKRAKKSRIPNYSKSIFNAQSDEIAERLINEDGGGVSDASSDSNKTIEYDPTPFQNLRPHSFSPLPSTSTDSETIRKNDELFNESLKEINFIKASTPIKKLDEITPVASPKETEDNAEITNNTTPKKKIDSPILPKLPLKNEDDLQIIDNSYDTIVIDDNGDLPVINIKKTRNAVEDENVIEIVEPEGSEVITTKKEKIHEIPSDEECMIVTSLDTINNHKNLDDPIVIDDEYSSINMDFYSLNNDDIEIIDVDDVIAENKSILDKWKTSGAKALNKINAVVDVPTTYSSMTSQQTVTPITTQAPQDIEIIETDPPDVILSATVQTTPSQTSQPIDQNSAANIENNQRQATPSQSLRPIVQNRATNIENNQRQTTPVRHDDSSVSLLSILNEFLRETQLPIYDLGVTALFDTIMGQPLRNANRRNKRPPRVNSTSCVNSANSASSANSSCANSTSVNTAAPVSTSNFQTNPEVLTNSSSSFGAQQTSTTNLPPSPVPTRNIGDCPICLDPLNSSNGIASTICGHVFCLKCIQASVKTNGKKCPTCRKALKGAGGGYHQLYL